MNIKTLAPLAALLGYGIFGFSFLFSKLALNQASPLVLLAVRFIVAFALMNLILFVGKIPFSLKGKPVKPLLLLGIIEPVIYFLCESYGIKLTNATVSGVIIALVPIAALAAAAVFMHEKPSKKQALDAVIAICEKELRDFGGHSAILPAMIVH